jgi:hypothetical protein
MYFGTTLADKAYFTEKFEALKITVFLDFVHHLEFK